VRGAVEVQRPVEVEVGVVPHHGLVDGDAAVRRGVPVDLAVPRDFVRRPPLLLRLPRAHAGAVHERAHVVHQRVETHVDFVVPHVHLARLRQADAVERIRRERDVLDDDDVVEHQVVHFGVPVQMEVDLVPRVVHDVVVEGGQALEVDLVFEGRHEVGRVHDPFPDEDADHLQ